jgi:glutaconate CoA-transferase subunit B
MGIFSFDKETHEMVLTSYHPGVSTEQIRIETGWPLEVSSEIRETPAPTEEELAAVRKYDPKGVWTS